MTFTAAVCGVGVRLDRSQRPVGGGGTARVRESRGVAALALHVVMPRVVGRTISNRRVAGPVPEVGDAVTRFAHARRRAAPLKIAPRAGVLGARPARLVVDVTRPTNGLLVRNVVV